MWKKSHIFIELLFNVDDDVASQSEIIAYRWFKVTEEAKNILLSLSYREELFHSHELIKNFFIYFRSNNKSRCESFAAFSHMKVK